MKMTPLSSLIPPEEALRRLLSAATPVRRTESVPLTRALGRVSARSVRAPRPIPAFPRATWDGYAARAKDTRRASRRQPVTLRVVAELHAEEEYRERLRPGECVAVATGAPLPEGADSVVIFEDVQEGSRTITLRTPVRSGACLAGPGDDVRKGETLVREGEVLTPARIGALGASGAAKVVVYARPIVVLLPNGNELLAPGEAERPGRVREINNLTLGAVVDACGGEPLLLDPVPDDPAVIQGTLEGALKSADLVISTGGSSVGERDFLPEVFPKVGKMLFHGVRVRPGKPTLAARAGSKLLLGMPGHPTSCLSNGYWLLLPLLRKLARQPGEGWTEVPATLADSFEGAGSGFASVLPVRLEGGIAYPTFRGSSAITSLSGANGFLVLSPKVRRLAPGSKVVVRLLLPPLGAP